MAHPTFGTGQFRIVAVIPEFAGTALPDAYWVVCETGNPTFDIPEYVLFWTRNLNDPTWGSAWHSTDLAATMRKAYLMAGMQHMPWEEIAAG